MKNKEIEKFKLELKEIPLDTLGALTKIPCSSCGENIPAENLNINDKIAKCNNCNGIFSFEHKISNLLKPSAKKQEVVRPEGIDIFYFQNDLDISIKQPLTPVELITICLLPFLVFLFTLLFWQGKVHYIFPAITWVLALGSIVNFVTRSKHKVNLNIDDKFLSIKWRPRKFQKDQYYPIQDIDQIYVKNVHGQSSIFMIVNGIDGQKQVPLLSGVTTLSKARYLEQEIEWHLGIEDREVPEEKI